MEKSFRLRDKIVIFILALFFIVTPMTGFSSIKSKIELHAHPSYVNLDEQGRFLLVSTSQSKENTLQLRKLSPNLSGGGKLLWRKTVSQPVKSQDISANADFILATTYDGKLHLYNRSGKQLWEKEHLAKPHFLKSGKILLINDDDSEPKTAFFVYDIKGKLLFEAMQPSESMESVVSNDEQVIATNTVDKKIFGYDLNTFQKIWEFEFKKPLAGFAVSKNSLALLTGKELNYYEISGSTLKKIWEIDLTDRYQTVKFSDKPQKNIWLYSNFDKKQRLCGLDQSSGKKLWEKTFDNPLQYMQPLFIGEVKIQGKMNDLLIAPIELIKPNEKMKILEIFPNGSIFKEFTFDALDGIFGYSVSRKNNKMAVAAGKYDEGSVYLGE